MTTPPHDSAPSRPVYETDLAQTPLPELLVTVYRYKAPGTLDCTRGSEQTEIFLDRGHIVFASTNRRGDERPASREEVEDIIWSVFGWESGTVRFTPGRERHREFVKLDIPIPLAIVQGVRHMPDAKSIVLRIGTQNTVFIRTKATVAELTLEEDEQNLLDAVDGKRPLGELVNVPPLSPGVNARLLYAFFVLGLIAVKESRAVKVRLKDRRAL